MNAEAVLPQAASEALNRTLSRHGRCNLLSDTMDGLLQARDLHHDQREHLAALETYGIRHEQKPLPFQGLPYVLTRHTFDRIADRFQRLYLVLERVIDLYLDDAEVRKFFRLEDRYDRLIRMGAAYRPRIQYCRYDFTLDANGTPRIYELNTHCPAAAVFSEYFARMFHRSRCLAQLREYGLKPVHVPLEKPGAFAQAMLRAAEQAGYLQTSRNVAVLNSRYLTMNNELDQIARQFGEQGCRVVRCHVEDLRFDGRHLIFAGLPIDLTYNKFDDSSGADAYECAFSRSTAEVQPYLDAYQAKAVFTVNTFPSMYLTEQKSTLAFLWSPLLHKHLSREEISLIEEVVPRSMLVRLLSRHELDIVAQQHSRYVLKRSLDTRGRSVLIGRTMTPDAWQSYLATAIEESGNSDEWVLQELAPVEHVTTRQLGDDMPTGVYSSLACFLLQGQAGGLIVRTSSEETTNVARQGFVQPALIVE